MENRKSTNNLSTTMKSTIYSLLLLILICGNTYAQNSNLILFSENGERFIAILNGLRQNDKHETNVKVTGLAAPNYKLKVIFEDVALGQSNFNIYLEPSTEATYVLKKNKKNEYVARFMSAVPIAEALPTTPQTAVVVYNPSAPAYIEPAPVSNSETVVQQTTITTTTGGGAPPASGGSISMGVNISETGGGFSMNVSGFEGSGNVTSQHSSMTTTTTTTTTTSAPPPPPAPRPAPVVYVPGYSGPIGCPMPLLPNEFESLKSSINSKTFEDSKMTLAKQATGSACLTALQVKDIMLLFTFEDNRLEFAKYAYDRTYDIGNYYKVNDAFTFELTIDELNEYINSRR